MTSIIIISVIVVAVVVAAQFVLISLSRKQMREEMRLQQQQFLQLAKTQFEAEQNKAAGDLDAKRQAVESTVTSLKEQLSQYQKLMRDFEQDRAQKYGNIEAAIKNATDSTMNLQNETSRLSNILGNVKLRGQWGERIAEDIIQFSGLIEGVNYLKQTKMENSGTRPDYTFLLPDDHKINMDVKFPHDNYMKMINTDDPLEKERCEKEFVSDVKERIKEIQTRDYINPKENTLDFVLLFIPNEQIFSMIHETIPGLMDESLRQKVVLCSPFTLYAMLSVIRQAFENFRYEKDMKKIIVLVDQFVKHYDRFKGRFEEIGSSIEKLEKTYDDVKSKNFKSIDTKIRHIEDYKKGQGIALEKTDEILIDLDTADVDNETITQS